MRILGIDHGEARIGLAISDETGTVARPLQIVEHTARDTDAETIARLAADHKVKLIVIGLPTDSEGELGPQARKVKRWTESLRQATSIAIEFWDESFSTQEAQASRPGRNRGAALDAHAAAVMLQNYLDSHRPASGNEPPQAT